MVGSLVKNRHCHIAPVPSNYLLKKLLVSNNSINGDDGTPGFGVYLHWPFCAAKCPYCDFNSHVRHKPVNQADYVKGFLSAMKKSRAETGPRDVTSIFIGGGTPSLMEPTTVQALLDGVAQFWGLPDGIEVTMEANPSSVEANRFKGYRSAGVNRVSLGVQALNDTDLKFLGRLHNVEEAKIAIGLAREIFPRLSFDLIYARPKQTLEAWESELQEAISYAADHLSLYQLTIEDGTPFKALHKAGKLIIPSDDMAADLYDITEKVTATAGLPNYEISNYAKRGSESRHNLTYWRYGDYVGIGPGAHGRFTRSDGKKEVTIAQAMPEKWLSQIEENGDGIVERETLNSTQQGDELLLMGLRLVEGMDLARYELLTGKSLDQKLLYELANDGLIESVSNTRLRATQSGRMVLNTLVSTLAAQ
ncbi:Radical S-adenosyl methionine domain-containing protein 1, mitochondrial [Nymphon striatum]|nr:Radical S-adenosyl methionine domain-containing protein 1, mitochondrial [Nymphon striatum]